MPSYALWHPFIIKDDSGATKISMHLTPEVFSSRPGDSPEFIATILSDIGVCMPLVSWRVLTFRSTYHGSREEGDDWRDVWSKNWRLLITLSGALDALPAPRHEGTLTDAIPDTPDEEEPTVGCIVIADFEELEEAVRAKHAIAELRSKDDAGAPAGGCAPEIQTLDLGGRFTQLQIYLGMYESSFFESGAAYARQVMDICRQNNGITSFDERVDEWDEAYDPA